MLGCREEPHNRFHDIEQQRIANFQDRRATDSLLLYLSHENKYRAVAALAFASIQDSTASEALGRLLLEDSDIQVRINGAFALGQTGGTAARKVLTQAVKDEDRNVLAAVYTALGKVVLAEQLEWYATLATEDSTALAGLAWGIYRVGLRGFADSAVVTRAIELLHDDGDYQSRLAAAHFFSRTRQIPGTHWHQRVIEQVQRDRSPEVRMALAGALAKLPAEAVLELLAGIVKTEGDERVRVNAINAAGRLKLDHVLLNGLRDESLQVRIAASAALLNTSVDSTKLFQALDNQSAMRVKANLLGTMIARGSELAVSKASEMYADADIYGKAQLLEALSRYKGTRLYELLAFIEKQVKGSQEPIIHTAAAQALTSLDTNHPLSSNFRRELLAQYQSIMAGQDVAAMGIVATALGNANLGYRSLLSDFSFLESALEKLVLPKDYESFIPMENALAYFQQREPRPIDNEFNHPIDWDLVKRIPVNQLATVRTSKGVITLRLLVNEAPGSVCNFVQLARSGYFDGRSVHRVVPNFVIQTGCNRGDGFGSEDYSIRSEFYPLQYVTGAVGMASAGKDTEGTQWFITHSPTPHLEGAYTLFGLVEQGQAVVNKLDVGDMILAVEVGDH